MAAILSLLRVVDAFDGRLCSLFHPSAQLVRLTSCCITHWQRLVSAPQNHCLLGLGPTDTRNPYELHAFKRSTRPLAPLGLPSRTACPKTYRRLPVSAATGAF